MSEYFTCAKCGARMISKCPQTRNIFMQASADATPDEAMWQEVWMGTGTARMEPYTPGNEQYNCLRVEHGCYDSGDDEVSATAAVERLYRILHGMGESGRKKIGCHHKWTLPPGKTCMEGHEHSA